MEVEVSDRQTGETETEADLQEDGEQGVSTPRPGSRAAAAVYHPST